MGTLLQIDALLFVREPRSGRPIDGEAPMEPPLGYGSTHRSIFPESQFGTVTHPSFGGPVGASPNRIDAALLVRVEIAEGVY
jgi:hypothetical protein